MSLTEFPLWIIASFAAGIVVGFYVAWRKIHEEERTEAEYLHHIMHEHIRPLRRTEEDECAV